MAAHAAKMAESTIVNGEPATEITRAIEAWEFRWSIQEQFNFLVAIPVDHFLTVMPEAWRPDLENHFLGQATVERLIDELGLLGHKLPPKARTALKNLKLALAEPTKVDPRTNKTAVVPPPDDGIPDYLRRTPEAKAADDSPPPAASTTPTKQRQ